MKNRELITKMIRISQILIALCLLFGSNAAFAQQGENNEPMQYSIHTYKVKMGNVNNTYSWDIYSATATRIGIDGGSDLPYPRGTAYKQTASRVGDSAIVVIDFTGSLPINTSYQLIYREKTTDNCEVFVFYPFTLNGPIDIDLVSVTDICPDNNTVYLESNQPSSFRTTITYHVLLRTDVYTPDGNWSFRYRIETTGQSGASASIYQVIYNGFDSGVLSPETYNTDLVSFSTTTRDVTFSITYNDVPGVTQKIDFTLTQIEGVFQEDDIDIVQGNTGQNEIAHNILSSPSAGFIAALD